MPALRRNPRQRGLAERTALIDACPTLRDRGGTDAHEVVIGDVEGCLDLLLERQAYAGPVSIEWPEGQKLRVGKDRAHRIGQQRPVTIYRLIVQDSIKQRIVRLHRDKRDLVSDLLEGAETSARLSESELLDLIRA